MSQKGKMVLSLMGFALLIAAAAVAYNALSGNTGSGNDPVSVEGQSAPPVSLPGNRETPEERTAEPNREKAPDFNMRDGAGNNLTLRELIAGGKPIVLNFWASWCPPCREEMPEFDRVYQEAVRDIQFVMVDLTDGVQETEATGAEYIRQQGFSFPVFYDVLQEGAYAYGIRSIPTTLFIDKNGCVVAGGTPGMLDESALRAGIELIK